MDQLVKRDFMSDVTRILHAVRRGEELTSEDLLPVVYGELRRLAARKLSAEAPGQTITASDLVHEAYLRLIDGEVSGWENRRHFFGAAAEAMRRILVERARRKQRQKHGGGRERVEFEEAEAAIEAPPAEDLLALDEALERLAAEDGRKAELIKLRYFAGLTEPQAAAALGLYCLVPAEQATWYMRMLGRDQLLERYRIAPAQLERVPTRVPSGWLSEHRRRLAAWREER